MLTAPNEPVFLLSKGYRPPSPLVGRSIITEVGPLTLVASPIGLVAVLWPKDLAGRVPLGAIVDDVGTNPYLRAAKDQLDAYFSGHLKLFDIALDMRGTGFQREVWAALTTIPFGETRSYRDIAEAIGRPAACRAVGAANGRNPVAIIVPCHRVIGTGGSLTGFAGGLEAKRWLLAHEGSESERLLEEAGLLKRQVC